MKPVTMEDLIELKGSNEYIAMLNARFGGFLEYVGKYKDHYYCILFNIISPMFAYRCGYVELLPSESRLSKRKAEIFDMHGGCTYFKKWSGNSKYKWIGFDAAHACDKADHYTRDKLLKLFPEIEQKPGWKEMLKIYKKNIKHWDNQDDYTPTKEYMIEQCKLLIDQLIEYTARKKSKKSSENKL